MFRVSSMNPAAKTQSMNKNKQKNLQRGKIKSKSGKIMLCHHGTFSTFLCLHIEISAEFDPSCRRLCCQIWPSRETGKSGWAPRRQWCSMWLQAYLNESFHTSRTLEEPSATSATMLKSIRPAGRKRTNRTTSICHLSTIRE